MTKQDNLLLFVCTTTTESKPVKLETSSTVRHHTTVSVLCTLTFHKLKLHLPNKHFILQSFNPQLKVTFYDTDISLANIPSIRFVLILERRSFDSKVIY